MEVLIGGEKDLLFCQDNSYSYSDNLVKLLKQEGLSDNDVNKIKIWSSNYPKEIGLCDGNRPVSDTRSVIENDDADQQKGGSSSRDMGDAGSVLVIQKDIARHRGFEVQMFTRTDGTWPHRLLLSSYTLNPSLSGNDGWPDGLSSCSKCVGPNCGGCIDIPKRAAYDPNACGYTVEEFAPSYYTRTHRDLSVIMAMRQWMGFSTSVSNEQLGLPSQCKLNTP